jgi:large subunit ribosomal protein L7/L12
LKSSKDFVDAAPKVVKDGLTEDEANQLKAKLTSAGATVTIE